MVIELSRKRDNSICVMLGGSAVSATGVYLAVRRVRNDVIMLFRVLTSSIFIHLVDSFIITNLPAKPMWDVLGEPSPEQVRNEREKKTKGKK